MSRRRHRAARHRPQRRAATRDTPGSVEGLRLPAPRPRGREWLTGYRPLTGVCLAALLQPASDRLLPWWWSVLVRVEGAVDPGDEASGNLACMTGVLGRGTVGDAFLEQLVDHVEGGYD